MAKNAIKENPELLKELESEIRAISGGVRRLLAGPLNRRAILLLVHDAIRASERPGMATVDIVIDAIERLDTQYLKKKIASK
jgi:hypothetical protein